MIKQKKFNRKVKLFLTASTLMGIFALENKSFSAAFDHSTDLTQNTSRKRLRESLESTTFLEDQDQQPTDEQQSKISRTDSQEAQLEYEEEENEYLKFLCEKYTPYLNNELENYLKNPPIQRQFDELPHNLTLHIFSFCSKIHLHDNGDNVIEFDLGLYQSTPNSSLKCCLYWNADDVKKRDISSDIIKRNFFYFKKDPNSSKEIYNCTNKIVFNILPNIDISDFDIKLKKDKDNNFFKYFNKTINKIGLHFYSKKDLISNSDHHHEENIKFLFNFFNKFKNKIPPSTSLSIFAAGKLHERETSKLLRYFDSTKFLSLRFNLDNNFENNKFLFNIEFPMLKKLKVDSLILYDIELLKIFFENHKETLKDFYLSQHDDDEHNYTDLINLLRDTNIEKLQLDGALEFKNIFLKTLVSPNSHHHHFNFTKFSLNRCGYSEKFSPQTLQMLLNQQKNLKILKLSDKPVPDDFLPILAEKINTEGSSLRSLSLRYNAFSEDALTNFAQFIKENKTLYSLDISNQYDEGGFHLDDNVILQFIENISKNDKLQYLAIAPLTYNFGYYGVEDEVGYLSDDLIEWLKSEAFQEALKKKRGGIPLTIYGLDYVLPLSTYNGNADEISDDDMSDDDGLQ